MASALDHAEAIFAQGYRRELEQEENIWRSLPFLAATLAIELTALFQVLGHLKELGGAAEWVALLLLILTAIFSAVALGFTIAAVFPVSYEYIAADVDILNYAALLDAQAAPDPAQKLCKFLAEQYAAATDHNRELNLRKGRLRSIAGLCTLVAVFATVLLVGVVFWHSVQQLMGEPVHAAR